MEERIDGGAAPLEPVRPRVDGGAFRRPPILPVASVFMLFAGLLIGSRLAPAPTPSASTVATATSLVAVATLPSVQPAPTAAQPSGETADDRSVPIDFCIADQDVLSNDQECTFPLTPATTDAPPSGAISLEQAMAKAKAKFATEVTSVVSAQLTDTSVYASGRWVWELTTRTAPACTTTFEPGGDSWTSCEYASGAIIVDALTGNAVLATSPSGP